MAITFPYVFTKHKDKVTINSNIINVEIAKTNAELKKGLSGRKSLNKNSGMLFVFEKADIHPFWMKNTLIPLDILFIENNIIVDITTLNPPVDNNIPEYSPKNPANYVLEVNAGFAEENNIKIGNEVKIN